MQRGGGGYGSQPGGGFMAGGTGGGYGAYGGDGGGGGGEARSRSDSLQPVTVKQLLEAGHDGPDDKFTVNGEMLHLVTFVGRIMWCDMQITMIEMKVDDCTGMISCVFTTDVDEADGDGAMNKREYIREHKWVRIVGTVREVSGALQVDALAVKGVEELNELIYHRLEVVRAFCSQTRPRPGSASTGITPVRQGMQNVGFGAQSGAPVPFNGGSNAGVGFSGGGGVADGYDDGNMPPPVKAVYIYLKSRHEGGNQGDVHIGEIAKEVSVGGETKVRGILEQLAQDGHVYSTIDDDHYSFCQA